MKQFIVITCAGLMLAACGPMETSPSGRVTMPNFRDTGSTYTPAFQDTGGTYIYRDNINREGIIRK